MLRFLPDLYSYQDQWHSGLSRAEPKGCDSVARFPLLKQEGVRALGTSKEVHSILNVDTIIMVGIF